MRFPIPNGVEKISSYAFSYCSNLKDVNIPDSVYTIGSFAFSNCSGLEKVSMSKSVTSISYCEFLNCTSLSSITIPETVTSISGYAFYGCESLTDLDIPENLTTIEGCSFTNCSNLNNLIVPETVTSLGDDTFKSYHLLAFDKRNTISVYSDSYAEAYAIKWDIPYEIIGDSTFRPANLKAEEVDGAISLNWSKVYTAQKYNIYRSDTEDGEKSYLDETSENTYLDITAKYGKTYYYFVTTIKEDGEQSDYSDYAVITPKSEITNPTPITGTIIGVDADEKITVELLDSNKNVIETVTSTDGNYSFNTNTNGEEYFILVSMPKCAPREYSLMGSGTAQTLDMEIRQYGDIHPDGVIDAKDATQILRYEAGLTSAFDNGDEYILTVANVVSTDELSAKDATQILRYEAGMTSVFDTLS